MLPLYVTVSLIWISEVSEKGFIEEYRFHFMQIFGFLFLGLIGGALAAFFGIPVLFVLDKYFSRFTLRYVIGGPLAGYVVWEGVNGPLLSPGLWFESNQWINQANFPRAGHYVFLGLLVGIIFSLVVRLAQRRQL